jgi:hypothetical protein
MIGKTEFPLQEEIKMVLKKHIYRKSFGVAVIAALIFIAIFSALAISMAALSTTNVQISSEQHQVNSALAASQSGLDCGRYLITQTITTLAGMPSMNTLDNFVTADQANTVWNTLCSQVQTTAISGKTPAASRFTDTGGSGDQITIPSISYGNSSGFTVRFFRYDSDPNTIELQSTGTDGQVTRYASIETKVTKSADVLKYAIASRGRMWITGDSTIHGDIYSAWNLSTNQLTQLTQLKNQIQQKLNAGTLNSSSFSSLVSSLSLSSSNKTAILNQLLAGTLAPADAAARCISVMSTSGLSVAPFNLTSDSEVLGTINTCWTKEQIATKSWQFETLDEDGNPMYDEDGNKIISPGDEIQGQCEGINYGVPPEDMSGMRISDYDTTVYYNATRTANGGNGDIPSPSATQYTGNDASLATPTLPATCGTKWRYEKFPHDNGNYTTGSGIQVKRYIYKDQTFNNVRLPNDKNALFINCTFDNVLYVDAGKTTSNYNNVRFDNCTFNGTTVTNTPQSFNWQKNTLYYTGSATFQNDTGVDATILAPHFNVNLGNTNPVAGTDNVLHGAIVGGIVDVRGNAEVFGTIISMADTSSYTSGYVTNIGATLSDGGSETVAIGDVGTINITPDPAKMLPSGITTPIIIKPNQETYTEN